MATLETNILGQPLESLSSQHKHFHYRDVSWVHIRSTSKKAHTDMIWRSKVCAAAEWVFKPLLLLYVYNKYNLEGLK